MQSTNALEEARLTALAGYDVLDSPREEAFDRITRLVKDIFQVSMSTVTLIDGHRQWFKSRDGVSADETSRRPALCAVAIGQSEPLVVTDARNDSRFRDNEFVVGPPHIRFYAGAQLRTPDGHAIGTLCAMDEQPRQFDARELAILQSLADTVMYQLDLRLISNRDALTGVLSRHAFHEHAQQALALATRHRNPVSCIVFDLDHFRAVNDTHGQAVGDRVLVQSARACREALRKSDVLGRVGGEEFAVVLPHTTRAAAVMVAEKARRRIASATVESAGRAVAVSASFGIAELGPEAAELDELLRRADCAMYDAKRAGRNRCEIATDSRPPHGSLRPVLKAGCIAVDSDRSSIDCTVRGLSTAGATLDVVSVADVPESFKLRIGADGTALRCKVLTRRSRQVDVVFD